MVRFYGGFERFSRFLLNYFVEKVWSYQHYSYLYNVGKALKFKIMKGLELKHKREIAFQLAGCSDSNKIEIGSMLGIDVSTYNVKDINDMWALFDEIENATVKKETATEEQINEVLKAFDI